MPPALLLLACAVSVARAQAGIAALFQSLHTGERASNVEALERAAANDASCLPAHYVD